MHVLRQLVAPEPDRTPHDPLLDSDAVGHDGVTPLCHEPQPPMLEHEDGGEEARDGVVQSADRGIDGPCRLDLLARCGRRPARGRGQ